ncbi:hypothetical protein Ancab_037093 [Ancistrocladus abbreviatus]
MSATFIVFVCTRIICGRLRVAESRRMFDREPDFDLEQPEQRANGLEQFVVDAIPTMQFDRNAFSSMEDAQCSICLGEYQEKEELRIMPKCGHNFHLSCIDVWLSKQCTCPVCRLPVRDSFDRKHGRSASVHVADLVDDAEISMDHPNELLRPRPEHSLENASSLEDLESTSRISDQSPGRDTEPRP